MRRREFIITLGSTAAAWSHAARAQKASQPVIGFLGQSTPAAIAVLLEGLNQGLKEQGFADGQNVAIEFRWAQGHYDRLPGLASELVSRQVAVLFAGGPVAALAAKAATPAIPVVFTSGGDPVELGLVASLNRPGGNVTGVCILLRETLEKRLGLLHELVPLANTIGFLTHPRLPAGNMEAAARSIGLDLVTVQAATEAAIDAALASLAARRVGAVIIGSDPIFWQWRKRIVSLAAGAMIPDIYESKVFVQDGGLMSYGANVVDAYREAGIYVAKIIKGSKPADLPVVQSAKFELVLNLKRAKALGLTIPPTLLATADEVIE